MPDPAPYVVGLGGPAGPHQEEGAGILGGTCDPVTVQQQNLFQWEQIHFF
jgi:hypothetical protein